MKDVLINIAVILAMISVVTFFIGVIMLFFESKRKLGLKIAVTSIIVFIIGFGTCFANLSFGGMH